MELGSSIPFGDEKGSGLTYVKEAAGCTSSLPAKSESGWRQLMLIPVSALDVFFRLSICIPSTGDMFLVPS